jgi:hypothetical protein
VFTIIYTSTIYSRSDAFSDGTSSVRSVKPTSETSQGAVNVALGQDQPLTEDSNQAKAYLAWHGCWIHRYPACNWFFFSSKLTKAAIQPFQLLSPSLSSLDECVPSWKLFDENSPEASCTLQGAPAAVLPVSTGQKVWTTFRLRRLQLKIRSVSP